MSIDPQKFVKPGDTVLAVLPHSEVCLHMRVAGRLAMLRMKGSEGSNRITSVQIHKLDGQPFSSAVLPGEAGVRSEGEGDEERQYVRTPNVAFARAGTNIPMMTTGVPASIDDMHQFLFRNDDLSKFSVDHPGIHAVLLGLWNEVIVHMRVIT